MKIILNCSLIFILERKLITVAGTVCKFHSLNSHLLIQLFELCLSNDVGVLYILTFSIEYLFVLIKSKSI